MKEYLELFIVFAKIGSVTFGGGYAMLPILQREVVEKKGWVTSEEVMDYYAISQCTPGIIAINTSIFIGYKCKKVAGGIFSALGMAFPSIVIIILIAIFLQNIMSFPIVTQAFNGVRVAVAALVIQATITLFKKGVLDKYTLLIFLVSLLIFTFFDLSPIYTVIAAAICGILIKKGGTN